jgi:hypothetical protein
MSERHMRWAADRFYWALLDGGLLPRGGKRRRQLGYLFERFLPGLAIEQVQAVYRAVPGARNRFLACGAPAEKLREQLDSGALTLGPQSLPAFVDAPLDPAALNLLTGDLLPEAVRRLRRRAVSLVVAAVIGCCLLLVAGLERRERAVEAHAACVLAAQAAIIERALGSAAPGGNAQPPQVRLIAALRQLEQTRREDPAAADVLDCSVVMSEFLKLWPAALHVSTESIVVAPDSISVRAIVATMVDAQLLADALGRLSGWRLLQPQSEARKGDVVVSLRLEPEVGTR